ncbi:Hpt domain-containing protein [Deinococcus saxicola]|uniref:hybrid sensor histidine kinase/response regulator n=1 Tax=Deinococcus saxicola TaxID=249406 RepID=UPI0039EF6997
MDTSEQRGENSDLLSSFLQEAGEVLGRMDAGLAGLDAAPAGPDDTAHLAELGVLAHRLRGSAGLYGFMQLSKMAGLAERMLEARPLLSGEARTDYLALMTHAQALLRQGLERIVGGEREIDLGLVFARGGGAVQLLALLHSHPEAFKPRPLEDPRRMITEDGATALDATPADAPAVSNLEQELRQFWRENAEIWSYFAPEVREHLGGLRTELEGASAESGPDLDVMFRAAHTVKGSSYMVGLPGLGDFAHGMEDLLGGVRDGVLRLDGGAREVLEAALSGMDRILDVAEGGGGAGGLDAHLAGLSARMAALAGGHAPPAVVPATGTAQATTHQASTPQSPTNQSSVPAQDVAPALNQETASIRVPTRQIESLLSQMGELVTVRSRLGQTLGRLDNLQSAMQDSQARFQRTVRDFEERHLNPDMVRATPDRAVPTGEDGAGSANPFAANPAQQFDELEFDTYNDLNILARSITELSADFAEVRRRLSDNVVGLQGDNELLGKLLRHLRLDLTQTSRVAFSQAAFRLRRWARDHEARFEFISEGEDVRVDSAVLQRLSEPLMHLMTNALHHGVGSAESRQETGKPARGRVWLRAAERQNFLEVSVQDDGQGLDLEAIGNRALAKGLRSVQELDRMSGEDRARLILLPGLSTASAVSTVAGRGVGMDVVATAARQLGGELLINTRRGEGTTFTLRLPVTRRVIDVLPVQVAGRELGFAVGAVRALREIRAGEVQHGETGPELSFEGRAAPIIDLRAIWGQPQDGAHEDTFRLVVLATPTGELAARVDDFGQIEEVSVTPLGGLLSGLEYLSGTAVSASGNAFPVLDPSGLGRLARRPQDFLQATDGSGAGAKRTRILLVDDSLSVRRLVGRMLESGGYAVTTANDGQEALDLLQLDPDFGAVVSDLEMPRMNGYELLAAVRARPATAALPLMIMTTRAGEKHQRLALQLGASDYFTKPVGEALLLRRIGSVLAQADGTTATGVGAAGVGA